ncbi:MAG: hypothetical protein Q7R56_03365 [Nanoarchaeota archaeon]|nr:hypothetical protein [Nanoarchaeota archaeon]
MADKKGPDGVDEIDLSDNEEKPQKKGEPFEVSGGEAEKDPQEIIKEKAEKAEKEFAKEWAKIEHDTDATEGGTAPKLVPTAKLELYERAAKLAQYKAILESDRRKKDPFFKSLPGRILTFFALGRDKVNSSYINTQSPYTVWFIFFSLFVVFFGIVAFYLGSTFISKTGIGNLSLIISSLITYLIGQVFARLGIVFLAFIRLFLFVIAYFLTDKAISDNISTTILIPFIMDNPLTLAVPIAIISITELILAFYAVSFDPRDIKVWTTSAIIATILFAIFSLGFIKDFLVTNGFHPGYLAVILGIFFAARMAGVKSKGAGLFSYIIAYTHHFVKKLFTKKGIIIVILILLAVYGYAKYKEYSTNPATNPITFNPIDKATTWFTNFFEETKEAVGFGTPDIIETKPKSGIIFNEISTPLPYYEANNNGEIISPTAIIQATNVRVDTFDDPQSTATATFACKSKDSETTIPAKNFDDKETLEGLGNYKGEPLALTITCDLKTLKPKITFSNSEIQWETNRQQRIQQLQQQKTKLQEELAKTTEPAKKITIEQKITVLDNQIADIQTESNPYLNEEQKKEIVFIGVYKDFTTTTCLNIYTVGEENYQKPPSVTSACLSGCNLATLSLETQQPWVKPKEGSTRYTSIYPLTIKIHNDKTSNGNMANLKKLELIIPEKINQQFHIETSDPSFVTQPVIDTKDQRINNINTRLALITAGRNAQLSSAEKTFYYRFQLEQPTGPQGKLQATKICATATYDYQFTRTTTVTFKKNNPPTTQEVTHE